MAYSGEIKPGDLVINKKEYWNLDSTFLGKPMKVLRIEENDLHYTGYAFVYVELYPGEELRFYIQAIEKYKK